MSNGIAPSSCALASTWFAGAKMNSACGSMNFLMSHGQATRSTFTRSRVIHFIVFVSSAVGVTAPSLTQVFVERIETLAAFVKQLLIAQSEPRPALQHAIDAHAFRVTELPVLKVGFMHHLGHLKEGFVRKVEAFHQCFKSAVLAVMRKLRVHHVERQCVGKLCRVVAEHEPRFRIDESPDEPC